ncbi:MAG: efflux transporter outer membrane subunit [Alphaproteobacteria bacterium]|nr:efflux transporter outer membrane subunit [Alphaproteobacteria bacterium]MBV9372013.1 efflux transporter outer membrane subunit [Alphaproteobacteria bacterium]MBV9901713.1 efflux transporter outer membrane subunit [Alphaproteobacteria bacterium]
MGRRPTSARAAPLAAAPRLAVPCLAALCLAACAGAPPPRLAVAPSIASEAWSPLDPAEGADVDQGWAAFRSDALLRLIARARAANTDIAVARARIVQARGQLGVARAAALPTLSASAGAEALRASRNGPTVRTEGGSAGLDVAWDLDLFGEAKAGRRAARARLAAAGLQRDATALAVESEVARAYVAWAALTDRLAVLDRALANAREMERIILVRVREGAATKVDSGLQTIEVKRIEAERSQMAEARGHARNALALLVGEEAPLFAPAETGLDAFAFPDFRPVQPGALLVRRPDVRAAEAQIAAAEGDVEAARRAFLPSLRLSARGLGQSVAAGGPLQLLLSAGASLLAPIFDGGRLRGNLVTASGVQMEAVETYRATLLTAVREGEDALTALDASRQRVLLLSQTIEEARLTARLARRQYVEGAADLQTVLDAERGLLDLEDSHALAAQDRLDAAIDLYRAMGGTAATSG